MRKHNHNGHGHGMPEPEKIKELLDMVSERIPNLLKKLGDVLYSEDQAHTFGKAVAIFYNELKDTGMTQEQIFELTKAYMSTLNMGNMMGHMGKGFGPGGGHQGPPWKNKCNSEDCDDEE